MLFVYAVCGFALLFVSCSLTCVMSYLVFEVFRLLCSYNVMLSCLYVGMVYVAMAFSVVCSSCCFSCYGVVVFRCYGGVVLLECGVMVVCW